MAAAGPIAVVWEDLQWRTDAQLDLVEPVVAGLRTVPGAHHERASILGREFYVEAGEPVLGAAFDADHGGRETADPLRQLNILEPADGNRPGMTTYEFVQSMLIGDGLPHVALARCAPTAMSALPTQSPSTTTATYRSQATRARDRLIGDTGRRSSVLVG